MPLAFPCSAYPIHLVHTGDCRGSQDCIGRHAGDAVGRGADDDPTDPGHLGDTGGHDHAGRKRCLTPWDIATGASDTHRRAAQANASLCEVDGRVELSLVIPRDGDMSSNEGITKRGRDAVEGCVALRGGHLKFAKVDTVKATRKETNGVITTCANGRQDVPHCLHRLYITTARAGQERGQISGATEVENAQHATGRLIGPYPESK